MSIIVSDTSPLRALHHLQRVDILARMYQRVLVPPAVGTELSRGSAATPPVDLARYSFVELRTPSDTSAIAGFRGDPDLGESEALALPVEVGTLAILMDEMAGRAVATRLGLIPIGALGILARARREGWIPPIAPMIDSLRVELRFRLSDEVVRQAIRLAGDSA